jgi:HK97 gp10 family phage protein
VKMTFTWDGQALGKALEQLRPRVAKRVQREALAEAAEPLQKRMEQLAPRGDPKSPNLGREIVIAHVRGVDVQETTVAVGPSRRAFYGGFQEFGTAHHAAQPFARPAFDAVAPESLRILSAVMWRELAGRGVSRSGTAPSVVGGEV